GSGSGYGSGSGSGYGEGGGGGGYQNVKNEMPMYDDGGGGGGYQNGKNAMPQYDYSGNGGGYPNEKSGMQDMMMPGGNEGDSGKKLLSEGGVSVEVDKKKKVTFDTEFTLSLKWRPFNTAKSIKKMLLFFPKRLEKSAFNSWQSIRSSSSKYAKDLRKSEMWPRMKAPATSPVMPQAPAYGDMKENAVVPQPAPIIEDKSKLSEASAGEDANTPIPLEPNKEIQIDQGSGDYGSESSDGDGSSSGSDSDSDSEWSFDDTWGESPDSAENKHKEKPEDYPFFVRLSSYDPNEQNETPSEKNYDSDTGLGDAGDIHDDADEHDDEHSDTIDDTKDHDQDESLHSPIEEEHEMGDNEDHPPEYEHDPGFDHDEPSREYEDPSDDPHAPESAPDEYTPDPDEINSDNSDETESPRKQPERRRGPVFYDDSGRAYFKTRSTKHTKSAASTSGHHRKKKSRQKPGYVLIDSEILVNTICPHMLNDFKSSPQQWGKRKSVSVTVSNATLPTIHDPPRYFPGDHVSSKGSLLTRSLVTLAIGLLSSLFPF
ncbi:hypothetical protein OXX80_007759, partial [Metschnikowia pulcherrima]